MLKEKGNLKEELMRRIALFVLLFVVAVTWSGLYPVHSVKAQGKRQSSESVNLINITGKVTKESDAYYIQGQTPPEVFRILNPIPNQLDRIVKSGKSVHIEARIALGDNVDIEKIDGKPYQQK
jgi:hypothetical protein